jgi:hypothetical protein
VSTEQTDATKLNMTEASAAAIKTNLDKMKAEDFLCITNTASHTSLDCTWIYVMNDAVFTSITVGGSNVVTAKGLSAITIVAGTWLPFEKAHATEIQLASGKVIAHTN